VDLDAGEALVTETVEITAVEKEPAIIADPGVSPADGTTVVGVQTFTFGFKSATGKLKELELDIYLGDKTGKTGIMRASWHHLPAGSDAVPLGLTE